MLRRVGVGAGDEDAELGEVGQRGPDLLAVDHVLVAVADRPGAQVGEVGAGAGLAEQLAPDLLAGEQRQQVAVALCLRAGVQQRGAGPADADHVARPAHPGRPQLVVDDDLGDGVGVEPVGLRPVRRDVARLGQVAAGGVGVRREPRPHLDCGAGRRQAGARSPWADRIARRRPPVASPGARADSACWGPARAGGPLRAHGRARLRSRGGRGGAVRREVLGPHAATRGGGAPRRAVARRRLPARVRAVPRARGVRPGSPARPGGRARARRAAAPRLHRRRPGDGTLTGGAGRGGRRRARDPRPRRDPAARGRAVPARHRPLPRVERRGGGPRPARRGRDRRAGRGPGRRRRGGDPRRRPAGRRHGAAGVRGPPARGRPLAPRAPAPPRDRGAVRGGGRRRRALPRVPRRRSRLPRGAPGRPPGRSRR